MKNQKHEGKFPGFPPEPVTNYWPYPKALNGWWHALAPTEQKVLDYILRHTWGYKKSADAIALSQFMNGIVKKDGSIVDKGTGIKDERTIRKALKQLEHKGFIQSKPVPGEETIYALTINPSQELVPLSGNVTPPPSPDERRLPSHAMSPTIKDVSIKDNNNVPASQDSQTAHKKGIVTLIAHLANKLGYRFPNYGKQAKYVKAMLLSGYSSDDIMWAIDVMAKDKWWSEHSFDMKNVADEIPKLMTRTFKGGETHV